MPTSGQLPMLRFNLEPTLNRIILPLVDKQKLRSIGSTLSALILKTEP